MAKKKEEIVNIKRTSKGVIVLVITLFVLFLAGCVGLGIFAALNFDDGTYTKFDFQINGDVVINNKIKINNVNTFTRTDTNGFYLEGYLKNIGNRKYEYVTVEYSLYDKNDVLIDRISSSIKDLRKDQQWKFTLASENTNYYNVARYELTEVNVY